MQNKRTFEGTYKINDGEEKDFSFDYTIDSQNCHLIKKNGNSERTMPTINI